MSVTVFSQPLCRPCERVKNKLREAGIDFYDVDILKNDLAYSTLKALGAKSTPVVVADGFEPILGYDPIKLKELIDELRV
jgi:glutaredoxin-like protein NrdH